MRTGLIVGAVAAALAMGTARAQPQTDLGVAEAVQQSFDRCTSRVMVQVVTRTERAALDTLVYDHNPLFHYPSPAELSAPATVPALRGLDFGGTLVADSIRDKLAETPLTEAERAAPMAWPPLTKLLVEWDFDATEMLRATGSAVSGEKWGNTKLVRPLQQISTAYLHGTEIWAKVEFRPELTWVPADDEDGDGYRELYARVAAEAADPLILDYLRGDYLRKPLDAGELTDYFFSLSSDWYQALQTTNLEPEDSVPWPNAATEPEIQEALGGRAFSEPFAVIRGKPFGQVIYNVFLLSDATRAVLAEGPVRLTPTDWAGDLERWGGTWEGWSARLAEFQADVRGQLESRPAELRGLVGRNDWLFFRGDLDYLLSGDLRQQPDKRDPYPAIIDFHEQLKARGIDVLLVVIPTKAEVYPGKLSDKAPPSGRPYVAPYCRKLLGELSEAGVGVVDLLPVFLAARTGDEPLYMPQDTHWTNRGVRLAARAIAAAARQRPDVDGLPVDTVKYGTREVTCTRAGDICEMLTEGERAGYRPMKLSAQQVLTPGGQPYVDDPQSPLVVLGDSFTGVFQLEDCKHAGLSAHLARELGMPVDLIMAQGSGPRIRGQFARRGHDAVSAKKLVIWTVVSRDLYNYWAPWEPIKVP